MKILLCGDPHLKHTHLSDDIKLLKWVESTIVEEKPDLVVNLGDVFDTHAVVRSECLSIFKSHVDYVCKDLNTKMIVVLGNHDMYRPNDARYHALKPFIGLHKNLKIIEKPEVIDDILYVPYLTSGETWPQIETSIAITHNTFVGADFGFKTADVGFVGSETLHNTIISGHVHKRHTITDSAGHRSTDIVYVGSPRATTAADAGLSFGLSTYIVESGEWKFIPSIFPSFCKKVVKIGDNLNEVFTNINDHYIVDLVGTRAEIKSFLTSKEASLFKKNFHVSFRSSPTDSVKIDKQRITATSMDKMVEEYLDTVYTGNDSELLKEEFGRYYEHFRAN